MGKYLLILLLCAIGCGGGVDNNGFRDLNDTERLIWDLTVQCFVDSGIEPFASAGYAEPGIKIVEFPCGQPNFAGCGQLEYNGVEIAERFYLNTDNPTPVNTQLLVHEYKHIIQFQGTGDADSEHDGLWYSDISPCPDDFIAEVEE